MQCKQFGIVQGCITRSRRNTCAHGACQRDQPKSADEIQVIIQMMEIADPQGERSYELAVKYEKP